MILNNDKSKNFQSKTPKFDNKKILPILGPSVDENILTRFAKLSQKKEKQKKKFFKSTFNKEQLKLKEASKNLTKKTSFNKNSLRGNKSSLNFVNKGLKSYETPEKRKERLFIKASKYDIGKLKLNITRRFQKRYKFLNSRDHLVFNLIVKPNNVFSTISRVCTVKSVDNKSFITEAFLIKSANSSTYNIKFSKRGIKGKTLGYLKTFLKNFKFLKVKRFRFAILNITCARFLRKHILTSISKFFLSKKFLRKEVIINVKDLKVFNGCVARKQRRKKRKKFVLYK